MRITIHEPFCRFKNQKAPRYAMLLRCSSDDQAAGDFTTIDTQRQINGRFIEERIAASGGVLVGEYIGEGKSGKDLKRPDWSAAYADAKARKFDVLVISYMSRLARGNAYHVAEYLLGQENVRIEMVKETFTPDMAGRIQKDITIFGDGLYIQKVSEWTRAKQSEMMSKGYICGGHRIFGFEHRTAPGMTDTVMPGGKVKPAPKVRVPHPDEAPVIVRAFQIFIDTDNMGNVQRYLRSAVPDRAWSIDNVRRLLTHEAYIRRFALRLAGELHGAHTYRLRRSLGRRTGQYQSPREPTTGAARRRARQRLSERGSQGRGDILSAGSCLVRLLRITNDAGQPSRLDSVRALLRVHQGL
jgi:hypothetical protein